MKLLFDVHLSIKLARHFQQKGIETEHVNRILSRWNTPDSLIAEFADWHDFILISKDGDFKNSHFLKKTPRKLVRIVLGNISNETLISILENNLPTLENCNQHTSFYMEVFADGVLVKI